MNTQMTEEYVSFEIAKLLKEKGFDYYPDGSYWLIDANNVMYWVDEIGVYDYVDNPTDRFQRPKNGYRLVTLQMAMKWLREVHHIHIEVHLDSMDGIHPIYDALYSECVNIRTDNFIDYGDTYEQACEAAIKYCLTNLI